MSIYKQYCSEIVDENGRLQKITLEYPDNFNFGYDVVDKIADETPQKRLTKCRKNTWLIISSVRAIYPVYNEISIMGRQIADYELIHIQSLSLFAKIITTNICYIVFYHYICTVFMMYEN